MAYKFCKFCNHVCHCKEVCNHEYATYSITARTKCKKAYLSEDEIKKYGVRVARVDRDDFVTEKTPMIKTDHKVVNYSFLKYKYIPKPPKTECNTKKFAVWLYPAGICKCDTCECPRTSYSEDDVLPGCCGCL